MWPWLWKWKWSPRWSHRFDWVVSDLTCEIFEVGKKWGVVHCPRKMLLFCVKTVGIDSGNFLSEEEYRKTFWLFGNFLIQYIHNVKASSGSRGVPRVPWNPPSRIACTKESFIWHSQTLNTRQKARIFVIVNTTYLDGLISHGLKVLHHQPRPWLLLFLRE